jgi:hypothetical protein
VATLMTGSQAWGQGAKQVDWKTLMIMRRP